MKIVDRRFLSTPTPSVHAATIAFYKDHPVFSWFGGSREGSPDVAIYLHNLNNDEQNIVLGDKDAIPRWNPILVPIKDKLILFEKAGTFCDRWQTFVHDISNWTNDVTRKEIADSVYVLPAGLNGPVKSCPIVSEDVIVCGSSVETMYDWTSYIESYEVNSEMPNHLMLLDRSEPLAIDEKKTYQDAFSGKTGKTLGIIQPTLWLTEGNDDYDGDILHAFFRSSRGLGKIYYARRYFENEVWDIPRPTNLDNPNSAVDVVYHKNKLYLVHNPDSMNRSPLVVSEINLNYDGESAKCDIVNQIMITEKVDEKIPLNSFELSYPYMIEHDNKLHLVYTYGRSRIEYVTIEI
jgi:predicted neuraminidase